MTEPTKQAPPAPLIWGGLMGAWGILTGVAVFFTWQTSWHRHGAWFVLGELILAVGVAWIIEHARERIEPRQDDARPPFMVSVLILFLFEFFVLGWHSIPQLNLWSVRETSRHIMGEPSRARSPNLFFDEVRDEKGIRKALIEASQSENITPARRILEMQTSDTRKALLNPAPPKLSLMGRFDLCLALNMCLWRPDFYSEFYFPFLSEEERGHYRHVALGTLSEHELHIFNRRLLERAFPKALAPLPGDDKREWFDLGLAAVLLLIIGVATGVALSRSIFAMGPPNRLETMRGLGLGALAAGGSAFLAVLVLPTLVRAASLVCGLFSGSGHYRGITLLVDDILGPSPFLMPLGAAVMFGIPGAALGALAPWLQPASESPKVWGILASLAAAGLLVLCLIRGEWILGLVLAILLMGSMLYAIRIEKSVERYWPLGALSIAILLCVVTSTVQLSLGGALQKMHLFIWESQDPIQEMAQMPSWFHRESQEEQEQFRRESEATGRALELCVIGSLGFWITIGMLATWATRRKEHPQAPHASSP